MSEGEPPSPLKDLDTRLRAARERQDENPNNRQPTLRSEQGASAGYRVSVDLFAGMLFGGGVGWFLDRMLGTKPWLMVVLFILGSAAGLLNGYRAVIRAQREEEAARGPDDDRRRKD
jgi:ATP synthase protein I